MGILKTNKNQQCGVEKKPIILPPQATEEEKEYKSAIAQRKKLIVAGLAAVIIAEGAIGGGMFNVVQKYDFKTRVLQEFEIRHSGKVHLKAGTYEGDTDFGYFTGNGSFNFNSGTIYTGQWNDNLFEGTGELKIPSSGTYEGDFSGSKKTGEGVFTWEDGTIYNGEWKEDHMDGKGEYREPDGTVYEGIFQEDTLYSGTCSFKNETGSYILTYKKGNIDTADISFTDGTHYVGTADEKTINGSGTMSFSADEMYSGSFENGKRSGTGTYTWANGDTYDGEWSEDKITGTGTYTFDNGADLQGTFKDNVFTEGRYHVKNDFGEYLFNIVDGEPNAVAIVLSDGTQFAGDIKNGKLNGKAQIKYSNGDSYEGSVENAEKSGKGKYIWASGASYEGDWEDDEMSGSGTYMYPPDEDGYKRVGEFEEGQPEGECKYYTDLDTSYDTTWSNGRCVKVTE